MERATGTGCYRGKRIKESLGWKSPAQYRKPLGMTA